MEQIILNLVPGGVSPVCYVSQYDIGRKIRLHLRNGSDPYVLSGDETVTTAIRKASGEEVIYDVANTSDSYVDLVVNYDATDVIGESICELIITESGSRIGSANFKMRVDADVYGSDVEIETAGPAPVATFDTNIVDNVIELKANINPIQEGTPWIDSNVIEKEPYNFRKVAGTASRIGNHLFDKLVGGTVAWNQLAPNNFNVSTVSEIMFDSDVTIVEGHKYFISRKLGSTQNVSDGVYARISGSNVLCFQISQQKTEAVLRSAYSGKAGASSSIEGAVWIYHNSAVPVTDLNIIDLTACFGSTIADYIYSLEQATAGAGVAFFRKLFPNNYYAHNAGELMSVKTTSHKMVGKNLYNADFPTTTKGSITLTNNGDGTYTINGSNPNDTYFDIFVGSSISKLPKDGYRLTGCPSGGSGSTYFMYTVPNFHTDGGSGSTFTDSVTGGSICIKGGVVCNNLIFKPMLRLSNSGDDTYEPYTEHNYPLDDVELRGLFKLDGNNKLYADGDTYESSGDVTRKYGYLLINGQNTLNYEPNGVAGEATSLCYISIPNKKAGAKNFIATRFVTGFTNNTPFSMTGRPTSNGIEFALPISVPQVRDDLKTWFSNNPVELIFELGTQTSETADPFTNPQQVDANGTEEYVDNRSVAIPVGHETYYADIYDITGFSEANITRRGANFWDEEWEAGGIDVNSGATMPASRIRSKNFIPCTPSTSLYWHIPSGGGLAVCYYDNNKTFISGAWELENHVHDTPSNACYIKFSSGNAYGMTYNNDISINYPATDTEYHAYNSNTYTIAFGQTVYGGVLDVTRGKLTVTWYSCLAKDIGWILGNRNVSDTGRTFYYRFRSNVPKSRAKCLCDILIDAPIFQGTWENMAVNEMQIDSSQYIIVCVDVDTVSELKSAFGDSILTYELATPIVIDLTPKQIETLMGNNNIFHDGNGDTTVKYLKKS